MLLFYIIFITFAISTIVCRDFYAGMFKNNDFLVAQDTLYKGKVRHSYMYAKYGRYFKCPITYFRVVDRLGVGKGPHVQVVRGGIRYNYLVLKIKSPYNLPISVNIYVGCENKMKMTVASPTTSSTKAVSAGDDTTVVTETNTAGVTTVSQLETTEAKGE